MDQNNTTPDDVSLVAFVLAGKQHSFERLLNRYSASVTRLCTRILRSEHEAQDVVQEATLQAFLNLPRLKKPERFGAWYHAIAANLSYSMLRHRRELSLPIVEREASVKMLCTNDTPTLDEIQSAHDLHDAIIDALQDLSEVNRQAVIGYYVEGYNYTELAQLLGVPISTVKGRLFEGRRYLRGVLRPLAESRLQPTARKRKESAMETSELLELHIASFSEALLTQERTLLLRVADSDAFVSLALTRAESELLMAALAGQQPGQAQPHDLALQLLAPLGAQVEHIVVDVLARQTSMRRSP